MSEFRDALSELESSVSKELARLSRPIAIDPRHELVFRIWPFLHELIDALQLLGDDEPPPVPVDLVARSVGLLMGMLNQLGQPVTQVQLSEIAAHVHELAEELIALVDPDELAEYVAAVTQPSSVESAAPKVIDVTPRAEAVTHATVQDAIVVEQPPPATESAPPSVAA